MNSLKKKVVRIIAAGALALAAVVFVPFSGNVASAAGVKGTVTATELRVRTTPDMSGSDNILSMGGKEVLLKKDQEITIIAVSGEWYHIRAVVNGEIVEGYSVSSYITADGEPVDETIAKAVITAVELNVRKGPSTEYEKVEYGDSTLILKKDEAVTVHAVYDEWYYITYSDGEKNYNGFVKGTYIALEEGAVIAALSDEQLSAYIVGQGTAAGDDKKSEDNGKGDSKEEKNNNKETDTEKDEDKDKDKEPEIVVPEGCIQVERIINSKFNITGKVTASKLNVRKLSKKSSDVVTVLKKDDEVTVINSVTVTTGKDTDSPVKTRWHRIVVPEGDSFKIGYVVEDYLELDYTGGISAFTKYDKQKLKADPDKKTVVKNVKKKKLKIAKGETVTLIGEKTSSSGDKYYEVSYTVGENVYTGFVLSTDLNFTSVVPKYSIKFFVPIEEAANVEEIAGTEVKIVYAFEGANAVAVNAPALMMHESAAWATPVIRDGNDNPVMIYTGDSLEVLSTVLEEDTLWCYVRHIYGGNEYKGYISKEHVAPDPSLKLMSKEEEEALTGLTSASFEAKLASEGFPDSYKDALKALHEMYPLWEFKAFHTGLTWKDAIDNESIVGKNLIPNSKSIEWKSLEPGAYSYKTDSFVVFDGSTWVTASRDAIEYYMDPRNFLAQDTIFQFELLAYTPATQGSDAVKGVLKNTAMNGTDYKYVDPEGQKRSISFVDTFLMAAEYSGVSPLHLASRVKQEVTLGANAMSNSVTGTVKGYEGLYNYYNIGAYHSTESGGAIKNGLKFARDGSANNQTNINCLIPWNNQLRSIIGGAYYIGSNYINRGQNTIYLQKFNTTATSTYMHQYMANVEAPWAEGRRVFSAYEDPVGTPIVFMIPVYLDMPEEPAPYPVHMDNPNNWLKTLKVSDADGNKLSLTPTLNNSSDEEYSIVVESGVSEIKINATPVSSLAKVISDKKHKLSSGMNRIVVAVQAQNGDIKEFVINVFREGKVDGEESKTPEEEKENTDGTNPDSTNPEGSSTGTPEGVNPDGSTGTPDGANPDGSTGTPDGTNPDGSIGTPDGTNPDSTNPEGSSTGTPDGTNPDSTNPDGSTGTPDGTNPDGSTGTP
ncbi:MAG: hypothetical protein K6F93_01340 [Lachnospiraceae bacterium]|nr:hypothetical protein [Lachnospiraceae bacterium]